MNLDYLNTFRELIRKGSFSAVARELCISQPAVSFQIQKLESDLGSILIDRSQKKLKVTAAGQKLLEFANSVNTEHAILVNELGRLRSNVTGRLKIAASTIPGEFLVPPLAGEFISHHNDATARIDVMDSVIVIEQVKHGDYQLGFCGSKPPEDAALTSFRFAEDEIVLITSPSHPLAHATEVDFEQLKACNFISREITSGTRQSLEQAMNETGFDFQIIKPRLLLSNTQAVISAVEAGSGMAFVSSIGAQKSLDLGSVKKVNIKGFNLKRDFYCVYYEPHENLRLLEEFLFFVKQKAGYAPK